MRIAGLAITAAAAVSLAACSQVNSTISSDDPIGAAKNAAVCAAIDQPLQLVSDNVEAVVTSQAGQLAGQALQTADSAIATATDSATGQLALGLAGLDQSLQALLVAWRNDAVRSELSTLAQAVRTDVNSVQQTCSTG